MFLHEVHQLLLKSCATPKKHKSDYFVAQKRALNMASQMNVPSSTTSDNSSVNKQNIGNHFKQQGQEKQKLMEI